MTIGRDDLSKSQTVTVTAIEGGVPQLVEAQEAVAAFQAMIRKKSLADLEPLWERARSSLVAAFANGVAKDRAAVSAAINSPWSNEQTEGEITKLKVEKRQIYGRGKIDLLQARVIAPDRPLTTKIASEPFWEPIRVPLSIMPAVGPASLPSSELAPERLGHAPPLS
nr:hypothetical protein [Neorhizobium huautlense]